MKDIFRQAANVLATLGVLAINALASASGLNGQTTGEISDRFDVYFVPAGYVFSIWGLIYLALLGFTVYQALPRQRENPAARRIGYLYVLSGIANVAWLLLWHYEYFAWSMLAMAILLIALIAIYLRLGTGREPAAPADTWLIRVPFSIYLGWITVATVANATAVLAYVNWNGWGLGPEAWTVIMLVIATAITAAISLTRGDIAYALVIMWAFAGIAVKHSGTTSVAVASWVMVGIVALVLLLGILLARQRLKSQTPTGARDRW